MKKLSTRIMVKISILTAMSVIFYYFEFRVIPGSPLKVDLSDIPVLIGAWLMGPLAGFMIAFLKNLVHFLTISSDGNIAGELANFGFSVLLMLPVVFIKTDHKFKNVILMIVSVVGVSLIMNVFNYYVTFPLYGLDQSNAWEILNAVYLPFNIVKGTILMVLFMLIKPTLKRIQ
ncbi:ECF transporter S component [Erysipelothrix aquatica]|uniref:ECF transporter S component n=2 Tax=Erysipelothrix aquatica TaxID=2683714 RepID=UPI0013573E85|nr:ECF transporter S component [Erysipelothrix aquatica]